MSNRPNEKLAGVNLFKTDVSAIYWRGRGIFKFLYTKFIFWQNLLTNYSKKQNATRSDPKTMTPYRQLISESEHRGRWRTAKFSTPKSGRGEANRLSPDADAVDGGPQPKCGRQNRFQNGRQKANRPISIRLPAAQLGGCGVCLIRPAGIRQSGVNSRHQFTQKVIFVYFRQ